MLSAKELVRAVKEPRSDTERCPEGGDVGKYTDWSPQSTEAELEQRISSLFRPLSLPRIAVKSSLSEADWDENKSQFKINKNCGRQELGPLLPEEALYLLENNCILLSRSGVPLSLQSTYNLLVTETDLTLGIST